MTIKLLVVEDDQEFADYLRRGLSYEDYQVQIATSAEVGLNLFHCRRLTLGQMKVVHRQK